MRYKMYDGRYVEVDRKLRDMPNAQCGVRFDVYGAVEFISYNTSVITIDPAGWLTCTGTYSPTTRKQMGKFLAEYTANISYQDAKRCFEQNKAINIFTREEADLPL